MDRFQEMQVVVRIAERRSFSQAAEDLRIPRATVTNLIKRMEKRLGARLLVNAQGTLAKYFLMPGLPGFPRRTGRCRRGCASLRSG